MPDLKKTIKTCFFIPCIYPLYNRNSKMKFGGAEVQMFLISSYLSRLTNFKIYILTGNDIFKKRRIAYTENAKIYVYLPLQQNILNVFKRFINTFISFLIIWPDFIIIRGIGENSVINFIPAIFCKIFKNKKFIFSFASDGDYYALKRKGFLGYIHRLVLRFSDILILQKHEQFLMLKKWKKKILITLK